MSSVISRREGRKLRKVPVDGHKRYLFATVYVDCFFNDRWHYLKTSLFLKCLTTW